ALRSLRRCSERVCGTVRFLTEGRTAVVTDWRFSFHDSRVSWAVSGLLPCGSQNGRPDPHYVCSQDSRPDPTKSLAFPSSNGVRSATLPITRWPGLTLEASPARRRRR